MSGDGRVSIVLVLSAPRSGSTWLMRVLGAHRWAEGLGEYERAFRPRRVICRYCAAQGQDRCTLLHGIEAVPREDAVGFASARADGRTLIDSSKSLDWAAALLARDDIDTRIVHLVRHPCGFLESELRRGRLTDAPAGYAMWEARNRAITELAARYGRPRYACLYDHLADDPETEVQRLCDWLGKPWEPAALRYWEHAQHGPGGNGASSLYLLDLPHGRARTGDDDHYARLRALPTRADRRWQERLDPAICAMALSQPYTQMLREQLGLYAWPE